MDRRAIPQLQRRVPRLTDRRARGEAAPVLAGAKAKGRPITNVFISVSRQVNPPFDRCGLGVWKQPHNDSESNQRIAVVDEEEESRHSTEEQ
jgi:hypothetical protein